MGWVGLNILDPCTRVFAAGVPTKARHGADLAGRIPSESGAEDLQVSGPTEGTTGAHSTRTPGPSAAGKSRRVHETHGAAAW